MTDFESKVLAFLNERRKQGDGWTSVREIRDVVKPASGSKLGCSLATYVRIVAGVETRGGWATGQQFQVRMKEVTA